LFVGFSFGGRFLHCKKSAGSAFARFNFYMAYCCCRIVDYYALDFIAPIVLVRQDKIREQGVPVFTVTAPYHCYFEYCPGFFDAALIA